MPVRVAKAPARAVAEFALVRGHLVPRRAQRRDPALQRLRAAGAEGRVAEAGGLRGGQLEGVTLVVVPAAR